MKKIINILLIAILSIIFIGLALFVVNFAKDTFINDNTKADTVSKKQDKDKKDENKPSKSDKQKDLESNESNQDTTQHTTSNSQSLETESQDLNNDNQSSEMNHSDSSKDNNENQTASDEDYIDVMQYDKNGDGFISTSELTPEAQKLVDEGKLQPTSDAMAEEWSTAKKQREQSGMTQEELDNLSEDEQAFIGYNPNNPRGDVGSPKPVYSDDDTDSSEED